MRLSRTVTVLGGDARQRYLADALREKGCAVCTHAVPGVPDAEQTLASSLRTSDALILPLPAWSGDCIRGTELTAQEVLSVVPPGTLLCGGKLSGVPLPADCPVYDYGADEALAVLNAVPTAEAAIALALEKLPYTLWESRVLVIGCGRIGKALAKRLLGLGSRVSVSCRKAADAAWCRSIGCTSEKTGAYREPLSVYRCIFNTVPAPVFTEKQLAEVLPDCPILDLASFPGGLPEGLTPPTGYAPAPALPGRLFTATAGALICDAVLEQLHRMEVSHV